MVKAILALFIHLIIPWIALGYALALFIGKILNWCGRDDDENDKDFKDYCNRQEERM